MADNGELVVRLLELLSVRQDSLEVGTPANGGALKVFGNFNDPAGFREKLDKAVAVRAYAQSKLAEEGVLP